MFGVGHYYAEVDDRVAIVAHPQFRARVKFLPQLYQADQPTRRMTKAVHVGPPRVIGVTWGRFYVLQPPPDEIPPKRERIQTGVPVVAAYAIAQVRPAPHANQAQAV